MARVPAVASKRIASELPKFQRILRNAQNRDVNEADTVVIIMDLLERVFGYDKYTEITREYAIKSTYCDIVIKTGEKIDVIIEVKAIGLDLKSVHARQAIDYGAHKGVPWVVLTNGINWQVFRVHVDKKVQSEKFLEFDLLELSGRKTEDQETLFSLCRRAIDKDLISEVYEYKQSVNRYVMAVLLQSDETAALIRRLVRRIKPGLKVTNEEIATIIQSDVIRRELVQSDEAIETAKRIKRQLANASRKK